MLPFKELLKNESEFSMINCIGLKYTLKEEIFVDFAVFAKIREIKFSRKFSKSGVREIKNY